VRVLSAACVALDHLGRTNDAARTCRRALEQAPADRAARRSLARAYASGGAWAFAVAEWRQVLAQDPRDREARSGLASAQGHLSPAPGLARN
jgi:predicted Zn-dependent protease